MDPLGERVGQALSTMHVLVCTLAELPVSGVEDGAMAFATDGLKPGELAGTGTGAPLWYDKATAAWLYYYGVGSAGAPTDVDYLVGTADPDLTSEIIVGPTPGGELGNTWASPTVDATHSGSSHAATQAAAEATAAAAAATHAAAADPHTGYVREADASWVDLTDAGETTLHSHAGGMPLGLVVAVAAGYVRR
jgi:hypothetical protein